MKTKAIESVSNISVEEFKQRYLKPQIPVIIKGLANNTEAIKKWSLDYLITVCGDVEVDIFDAANNAKGTAFTSPDYKMPFKSYAELLKKNESTSLRLFLFNMFRRRPVLRKDFPCPAQMQGLLGRLGYMFFGTKGIKVRMHQDIDYSNVLLTQFMGRKKIMLVAPHYSDLLYKLPLSTFSMVELDAPDYTIYPGLHYIEVEEGVLEPGDALFMPCGYWHYIKYLDAGYSVSYRKLPQTIDVALKGLINMAVKLPLDKILTALLGKRFYNFKIDLAKKRADEKITSINKSENKVSVAH